MKMIMNLQTLQQKSGTSLMTRITENVKKEMKMIQALNLRQKSINQAFIIL